MKFVEFDLKFRRHTHMEHGEMKRTFVLREHSKLKIYFLQLFMYDSFQVKKRVAFLNGGETET